MVPMNKPQRRMVAPHNPILDVMNEPFFRGKGNRTSQSTTDMLRVRMLRKAFGGDRGALLASLDDCAAREVKLIREGRYTAKAIYELPNLEYERLGDVAALLKIARPCAAPPHAKRHPLERDPRHELAKWVMSYARQLGSCSNEHRTNIRVWEQDGCRQWRQWRDWEEPMCDEFFDSTRGEWFDPLGAFKLPNENLVKSERSIHPFDKKVWYPRNDKLTRMRIAEALMLCACSYVIDHPNDLRFASKLLGIETRMSTARDKQGDGIVDNGQFSIGDGKLYAALAVSSLEDALIGMNAAVILYPYRVYARAVLLPWIVQAALDRMKKPQLTYIEQMRIVTRTLHPEQVNWPDWWEVDWFKKPASD